MPCDASFIPTMLASLCRVCVVSVSVPTKISVKKELKTVLFVLNPHSRLKKRLQSETCSYSLFSSFLLLL